MGGEARHDDDDGGSSVTDYQASGAPGHGLQVVTRPHNRPVMRISPVHAPDFASKAVDNAISTHIGRGSEAGTLPLPLA